MAGIFLFEAVRTPRGKGKPGGALSGLTPHELVSQLAGALRSRLGETALDQVTSLTLGCVGQIGAQGGQLALVSKLHADLPPGMTSRTVNNYCVSGLTATRLAALEAAATGDDRLRLAGGVEMMSLVPFLADHAHYYDDPDTARALRYVPVPLSADLMATMEGISREALDAITVRSHQRAAQAWARGGLDEVIPVHGPDGTVLLAQDESVRPDTSMASLARLAPAFVEMGAQGFDDVMLAARPELAAIEHLHTLAHCPPIADGAALVLLGSARAGAAAGLKPRAIFRAATEASADPVLQLTAGFAAMDAALKESGLRLEDIDRIEFMEAFAATPVKSERDYAPDPAKVNPEGGHLAMGHPMGASGAILLTTLLAGLERDGGKLGLAVLHGGSGVGAAIIIERV
ncbi:acetyl-CoA C-acyltransferase [Maricaulis salignorans]|uniref:Acetyl-CoA acyltransferase n=1 Tax=Maricaulis salignorans TaxID=144026 RepID=A0A1G9LZ56_9PROT|nr:acetyl-CoA C-acyltransferase [Maricaulis salignorans]SDL67310.1 acetyl-CoA acyltransferase [Maricaulis salignorans]